MAKFNSGIVLVLLSFSSSQSLRLKRQGFLDFGQENRCVTPLQEPGICIGIKQCPPLVELLVTQRHKTEVVDYLRTSVCGYENLDPKVCCPRLGGSQTPQTTDPPRPTQNPRQPPFSTDTPSDQPIPDDEGTRSENTVLPEPGECGNSLISHTRVVGGVNASLGAWPWIAALGYKSTKARATSPVFLCGGSLISDRHVLTAAHCVYNKKNLYMVRLGDLNLYEDNDGATPIDVPISSKIVHNEYNPTTFINDIAILQLQRPVTFTRLIQPICLPISRELRSRDFVNRQPFIAGWGTVSFSGPSSQTLLELQIPVVSETECKRAFGSFKTAVIDKRVICAGYLRGGKDACRGDSGGPLMDPNSQDKLFYQIGIVSYGYKCAEPGFPGVYTRVTSFIDWIIKNVSA